MPKRKKRKPVKKLKQSLVVKVKPAGEAENLEAYIQEASEVKSMTNTPGWSILVRDLTMFRDRLINTLAYTDPSKVEHKEARVLFIAIDKIFSMVSDYHENRDRAIDLINKLENKDTVISMDVDNE